MELFTINENMQPIINKPDVLLIKEFKALFETQRCKIPGDTKGVDKLRAQRELVYIFLVYDWKTPYSDYSLKERQEAALLDSQIKIEWLSDPLLKNAIDKYESLQDSRILRLLRSAYKAVDELRLYFDTLDLTERDINSGKPIFATKNVMAEISGLGKTVEGLQQLEYMVMKEKEKSKDLRGETTPGIFD